MAVEDSLDIFGSDPFGRDYLYGLSTGRDGQGLAPYGFRYAESVNQPTTAKGRGYLGNVGTMQDPMTELSASSDFGGRTVRYPLIVPTLTADELNLLRSGGEPTQEIYGKAQQYALGRLSRGQDPFATTQELRYPQPEGFNPAPRVADQVQESPRGYISGLFSDAVNLPLQYMSSPERTQQMQGAAQFLYGTGIPKTLERISYGDSLFSGAGGLGGTTRMRPETADALMNVAPFAKPAAVIANRAAMTAGRAGARYAERVVPQVMERGGLPAQLLGEISQGSRSQVYRPSTPQNIDPTVGTRYQREYLGGLAEKTPIKIEDYQGASAMLMPWDSSSRNLRISSISDELLPNPVITHGGQDYARDLAHIEQGIGGASGFSIANRIKARDALARIENINQGGTGEILHLPVTMGVGAENFSVMPVEALMQIADMRQLSKEAIKEFDDSVRNYTVAKGTGKDRRILTPFKDFKGIMTEEGRSQIYTGEGVESTAGELRKAITDRFYLKENQKRFGFNAEDLQNAIIDPALAGIQKGYVGNTALMTNPEGMSLRPSANRTYNTDFTAEYQGTLGQNIPAEVLFPRLFPNLMQEFSGKQGDIRNMALGALEKRKQGVAEMIDQQVIDNYYRYLENQKAQGLNTAIPSPTYSDPFGNTIGSSIR